MRLGRETNGSSNELMMQSEFEKWIKDHNERYLNSIDQVAKTIEYKREVYIKEVSRYADFLLKQKNKLINIELKTNPSDILINQLKDHSRYCDYCFALVPDFCVLPNWFVGMLHKNSFGLIVYNDRHNIFTEAIPALKNEERSLVTKKKYIEALFSQKKLL